MAVPRFQVAFLPGSVRGTLGNGASSSWDCFNVRVSLRACLKIIFEFGWLPYLAVLQTGCRVDMAAVKF